MKDFWLATWEVKPPIPASRQSAQPLTILGASRLAIEVIRQDSAFAVFLSTTDSLADPHTLTCRIGFCNGALDCRGLHAGGMPLVDASIDYADGVLRMYCPFFPGASGTMLYGESLLILEGVIFQASAVYPVPLGAKYAQLQEAPDPGRPASQLRQKQVVWEPVRQDVIALPAPSIQVQTPSTRSPNLAPLRNGALPLAKAWTGRLEWPAQPTVLAPPPVKVARAGIYGAAAFTFKDIEVVGLRLDLSDKEGIDALLTELVAPLNACLERRGEPGADPGYRYVVATTTVLIEVLRYGSMALQTALPPLVDADYQSQHELVVRVLVSKQRLGGGTLTDPEVFVPAILVDNPWSKILGADLQGFDKRMAEFCVTRGPDSARLLPNGSAGAGNPPPSLLQISRINQVATTTNALLSLAPTLLELNCPLLPDAQWVGEGELRSLFRANAEGLPRWRLSDFDSKRLDLERLARKTASWLVRDLDLQSFGRERLALLATAQSLTDFNSVQASPVDERVLDSTLIRSHCRLSDLLWSLPRASAQIVIHALPSAPPGWKTLCSMLGLKTGDSERFTFQANNWYRLKFSMDLTTEEGGL